MSHSIHRLKTFDDKILIELIVNDYGTEFFTSNELSSLKNKINESNKDHGKQFDDDISSLDKVHQECKKTGVNPDIIIKNKFIKVSENWGLKYENY